MIKINKSEELVNYERKIIFDLLEYISILEMIYIKMKLKFNCLICSKNKLIILGYLIKLFL